MLIFLVGVATKFVAQTTTKFVTKLRSQNNYIYHFYSSFTTSDVSSEPIIQKRK